MREPPAIASPSCMGNELPSQTLFHISLLRTAASMNCVPGLPFLISVLHTMAEENTLGTCQDPHFKGAATGKKIKHSISISQV